MARTRTIRLALLVFGMSVSVVAQDRSQSQPAVTPVPAFGQNAPVLSPENPPVSGLDEPTLELRTASRSFVSPALQVSESADTNGGNQIGASGLESVSRVLGAFDLQQFWPKSDLFLEYLGGGAFYGSPYAVKQMHAAGLEAVTRWRTGQATLRDSFSYLPDGSFLMGYGGNPGLGIANGGGTAGTGGGLPGFRNSTLGSIGNIPRLANTAILDVVQAINPVSAFTVAGAFSNSHFYDPTNTFLNGDQYTAQGGYSHLFSRHDQIGVIYGFQLFQFPQVNGGEVYNHIVNVRWSHTLTGRMSFIAGVGPQFTDLQLGGSVRHWSVSGRAQLRYKFAHSSLVATYEKFTSPGSGFFAGADTQAVRLAYTRPLGRTWDIYADLGYSHNKRLQDVLFGAQATSYDEGYAGALLRKHFGRTYDFFCSYRFSDLAFNVPPNLLGFPGTGRIAQRHIGTIGVEWHPRPTRIE
ncbi:MAG: hypothetical protein LAO23_08230 [Acidobacteriia bacterium]|nr:hypothetical protein [Terriglobia bacterium]